MLFFTSDQHIGHARILELIPSRPWSSLEDMTEGLIEKHNKVVKPTDTVIILGDFLMGLKSVTVPMILPRLHGSLHLILGNHDAGFNKLNAPEKIQIYLDNGIKSVSHGCFEIRKYLIHIGVQTPYTCPTFNLCHFPYKGSAEHLGYSDRYEKLRPYQSPITLLHGHTHSGERVTAPNMIHIGVDAWDWTPVSYRQVLDLYKEMQP